MVATIIEIVLSVAPLVGIPILCHFDPAGHYDAELRRRMES